VTGVYDENNCCLGCGRHRARGHEPDCPGPPVDEQQESPAAVLRLVRMSEVKPERVSWLWQGYIPAGKLTLIDGDPGDGKSTMSLDLAARVSTGSPMPDGSAGAKGTVIILSAEDGIADTIRPRLDAAGADAGQVIAIDEVTGVDGPPRPVELPLDLPLLAAVIQTHDATLLTIDPLMAFLAGVDSHNDQSVRRALHPLSKLADKTGVAIVVIRHLNKGSGAKALYRGGGSIGIGGAARAVHVVAADPDDETRRLLAPVKLNLAVKPPTLAYRLVSDELHGVARVRWEGPVEATADELVNVEPAEDRAEKVTAVDFLTSVLATGPRLTREVEEEAREAHGISERTLKRARKALHIKAEQLATGSKGRNEWWLSLPKETRAGCQGATPTECPPGTLPTSTEGDPS
jgi:AAA domain-containing protein